MLIKQVYNCCNLPSNVAFHSIIGLKYFIFYSDFESFSRPSIASAIINYDADASSIYVDISFDGQLCMIEELVIEENNLQVESCSLPSPGTNATTCNCTGCTVANFCSSLYDVSFKMFDQSETPADQVEILKSTVVTGSGMSL